MIILDFPGNAFKCYHGGFENHKGAEAIDPRLVDCDPDYLRVNDACYSYYAKTDLTFQVKKFPETLKNWTSFRQVLFSLF